MTNIEILGERVIFVRPDDPRLSIPWNDDEAGHERSEDGFIYMVVGRHVSAEKLALLTEHYGVEVPAAFLAPGFKHC